MADARLGICQGKKKDRPYTNDSKMHQFVFRSTQEAAKRICSS